MRLHGGALPLGSSTRIAVAEPELRPLAGVLRGELATLAGIEPAIVHGRPGHGDIGLVIDTRLAAEEHVIEIDSSAVVRASTTPGAALATTMLLQAIQVSPGGASIPAMSIRDEPYAPYRGLLVDVARSWHPPEVLRQLIVLCRWYKVRYLQLHLTDDEAFTFPSDAFPGVATAGCSYTRAQLADLESFASTRGVTIVPELDVPGHNLALVQALPERVALRDLPETFHASSPRGDARPGASGAQGERSVRVIDPSRDSTYETLESLLGEMATLFRSSPYIHIGADEVDTGPWEASPACRRQAEAIGPADMRALHLLFIGRMAAIVGRLGRRPIVWEGFRRDGPVPVPPEVIVMPFSGAEVQPDELIALGHAIVNASWSPLYVVGDGSESPPEMIHRWNPYIFGSWGLWWEPRALDRAPPLHDVKRPLFFYDREAYLREHPAVSPYEGWWPRARAIPEDRGGVLGAQMCSWENPASAQVPRLRQRLAAFSQRVWDPDLSESYETFARRARATDTRLTLLLEGQLQTSPRRT